MQTCANSFPYFLSRAVTLSFLVFSTSLKQTNKATNETHLIERERERERSTSLSSIHLLIYPSSSCPTKSYYENIPIQQFTTLTTSASNASAFLSPKKNGFNVLQVCRFIHSDVIISQSSCLYSPNKKTFALFFFQQKSEIENYIMRQS